MINCVLLVLMILLLYTMQPLRYGKASLILCKIKIACIKVKCNNMQWTSAYCLPACSHNRVSTISHVMRNNLIN